MTGLSCPGGFFDFMAVAAPPDYEVHLRDYLYVLRKRRLAIAFFFLSALAAGISLTLFEKVLYRATSAILIEKENPNVVDFKEVMALDASETEYYQTQYQMLKSRSLIRNLIKQEGLAADPYLASLEKGKLRDWLKDQFLISSLPRLRTFLAAPALEDIFIRKMLKVDPIRNSRLVEVSVLHPDPKRSAELTNRLVAFFIQRNLEDRFMISKQATGLISNQLVELKDRVGAAERNLQKYKEEQGLVNIPSIHEDNKFLQDAKLELLKSQAEEAKLAKRYLPEHPKRIHINSQIEGLRTKLESEEKRILASSRAALQYQELEREAESAQQIYKSLLKRLQETASEAKTQASNVIVVDRAGPPPRPYKPKPVVNLLMAIFIGAVGGVCLAFFLEYLDSSVKIPEDVEKGLGLDLFGVIPQAGMRELRNSKNKELFFDPAQHSPAAESVRALRTALLFKLRHSPGCRALLITSPNPDEGKTTIALNLAAAFAQNHLKVALIDADLRKPKIHKALGVNSDGGLTDLLEKQTPFQQVLHADIGGLGFDFLSCGSASHHPTEILGSKEMKDLLENLKKSYDIILMDSPPYLAVADVAVLSEYAQAIIVIARYHCTDKRHLKDLKRRFGNNDGKVLGVVINQVSVREKDYYYHQYYYYGYGNSKPEK